MALENPPIKKKEGYPSKEELDYWIEQIRAGKDVDYFFERIVVCMTPYFRFLARRLDREFGSQTERAVRDYQTLRIAMGAKIGGSDGKADGEVGPATWNDLLGLQKV